MLALLSWIFRVLALGKLPPARPKCLLSSCCGSGGSLGMCDYHCRYNCECLKKLVAESNN